MNHEPTGGLADRLTRLFWRSPADGVGERCRRRVTVYLIPYLFFLYVLAYLDRVNVMVAQLGMNEPPELGGLGFNSEIIGIGFGMFFWGYWILEIPSTISVLKWGARWVFVRILVFWGLCCMLIGFLGMPLIDNLLGWLTDSHVYQFYILRFMLGFFEGGFFPSVIVYLSLWFRPEDRAKAIASFMLAIPLSNVFGAPISGLVLNHVHWLGLPGWRWVFILQGVVPILAGFVTIFMLPDRPEKARWLPADEKDWLHGELDKEHAVTQSHGHWDWVQQAGVVLLFTLAYFLMNTSTYGLQAFMPKIIQSLIAGSEFWEGIGRWLDPKDTQHKLLASLLTAGPYALALVGMMLNAWHSDKTRERIRHTAGVMIVYSIGLGLAATFAGHPEIALLIMTLVMGPCLYAWLPSYWPMPRMLMGAMAAASAVGFINMVGNLGGAVGSGIVGFFSNDKSTHPLRASILDTFFTDHSAHNGLIVALYILALLPLLAAGVIITIGLMRRKELMDRPAEATQPIPDKVQAEA